ncbi:LacI family DNA-binding transcriptional regulator [Paenibacillus sp. GYB003]|uniref:LacI family DNA-binding transcriptional regulator n=1 Tax=Paenibacillus sp. GYB003 TaxID=2994392 RepID=UPI002F96A563
MPRKKNVTLPQLAEKLGLSAYTVSKALRGLPGMSEQTRSEVIQLAKELGYLTKDQESSLLYEGIPRLSAKQRRFLMATSSKYSYSIQQMFMGLKERMNELGHKVDIAFMPETLPADRLEGWMEQEGVLYADGLFITPLIPEPLEAVLLELKLPRILINFPPVGAKVDSVIWDVYDATMQSVRYLTENGHRNIAYIGDTARTRGYKQRWLAFREAMKQEGEEVREESHLIPFSSDNAEWREAFERHLERSKPTALLCSSYQNVSWVFYACSEAGYRIPDDLSVIMLDNVGDGLFPSITRPELLMPETGYRAADRMLWRLANARLPYEHIRLQGTFFRGDTVKHLADKP